MKMKIIQNPKKTNKPSEAPTSLIAYWQHLDIWCRYPSDNFLDASLKFASIWWKAFLDTSHTAPVTSNFNAKAPSVAQFWLKESPSCGWNVGSLPFLFFAGGRELPANASSGAGSTGSFGRLGGIQVNTEAYYGTAAWETPERSCVTLSIIQVEFQIKENNSPRILHNS